MKPQSSTSAKTHTLASARKLQLDYRNQTTGPLKQLVVLDPNERSLMEIRYQAHTNMGTHELRSITVGTPKGDYVVASASETVVPRNTSGGLCDGRIKDAVITPAEKGGPKFNMKWLTQSKITGVDVDVSDPLTDDEPLFAVEMLLVIDDKGKRTVYSFDEKWNALQTEKQFAKDEMMKKLRKGVAVEDLGRELEDARRLAHEAASKTKSDAVLEIPEDKRL